MGDCTRVEYSASGRADDACMFLGLPNNYYKDWAKLGRCLLVSLSR